MCQDKDVAFRQASRECFFTFQIIQSTNAYRDPTIGQARDQVLGSRDEDVLTWSWRCSWARGQGEELYWVTTKSNTASLLIRTPSFQEPEMSFSATICHCHNYTSVQFSSVAQSCPTLCDPMNRSMPGLLVHHHLPEFTQTHSHRVSDAIQPSHPLSSPSPPAPNPSQHQSLFQWVNSSHEVAKVLEFQL